MSTDGRVKELSGCSTPMLRHLYRKALAARGMRVYGVLDHFTRDELIAGVLEAERAA